MLRLHGQLEQARFWCRQRLGALRNRLRPGGRPEEQSQQDIGIRAENIYRPRELSPTIEEDSDEVITVTTNFDETIPNRLAIIALRQLAGSARGGTGCRSFTILRV